MDSLRYVAGFRNFNSQEASGATESCLYGIDARSPVSVFIILIDGTISLMIERTSAHSALSKEARRPSSVVEHELENTRLGWSEKNRRQPPHSGKPNNGQVTRGLTPVKANS